MDFWNNLFKGLNFLPDEIIFGLLKKYDLPRIEFGETKKQRIERFINHYKEPLNYPSLLSNKENSSYLPPNIFPKGLNRKNFPLHHPNQEIHFVNDFESSTNEKLFDIKEDFFDITISDDITIELKKYYINLCIKTLLNKFFEHLKGVDYSNFEERKKKFFFNDVCDTLKKFMNQIELFNTNDIETNDSKLIEQIATNKLIVDSTFEMCNCIFQRNFQAFYQVYNNFTIGSQNWLFGITKDISHHEMIGRDRINQSKIVHIFNDPILRSYMHSFYSLVKCFECEWNIFDHS
eukprot:TRINITY_DN3323_c0_g4_i1.p1 TRINITY_DN3323_c0_g4~~TRINITY_DN3323_c0_g4_i1.p1  ORF type:complete len:291 (-),score=69.81 TRINITY_DN3323_c0_g4_i1:314-1186(-)